jgi:hypothetical protein
MVVAHDGTAGNPVRKKGSRTPQGFPQPSGEATPGQSLALLVESHSCKPGRQRLPHFAIDEFGALARRSKAR